MNRILIVDDEPNSVAPIMMFFEEAGYELRLLETHQGLFNMLDEFKPDIILLDIYLKDSDGRYLCNLLKSLGKTENIPIVLISGMMEESEVSERDILADGFLYKPFDLDESIQKIRALLN